MIDWVHHDSVTTANLPLPFDQYLKSVKKPQINGDRVRARSDEELAELLADIEAVAYERLGYKTDRASYKKAWLEWLKKEADNGTAQV